MYKVTKSGNDQYYLEEQLAEGLTCHADVFHPSTLATQSMVFRWQPGIHLFFSNFGAITNYLGIFCCSRSGLGSRILHF